MHVTLGLSPVLGPACGNSLCAFLHIVGSLLRLPGIDGYNFIQCYSYFPHNAALFFAEDKESVEEYAYRLVHPSCVVWKVADVGTARLEKRR